jgi:hypothetical protein
MKRQEYDYTNRQTNPEEENMLTNHTPFQDLINEVLEEETRFLKSINYPVDRVNKDWYYSE